MRRCPIRSDGEDVVGAKAVIVFLPAGSRESGHLEWRMGTEAELLSSAHVVLTITVPIMNGGQ